MIFAAACATAARNVETFYDDSSSFDGFETYQWFPTRQPDAVSARPFLKRIVETAIRDQLAERGYEMATGRPDFWVNYQVIVGAEADVRTTWDVYGRRVDAFPGWYEPQVDVYRDGTLIIDVLDPDTGDVLWRGVTSDAAQGGANVAQNAERTMNRAAGRVLGQFPP
jgi:hypothetical protein